MQIKLDKVSADYQFGPVRTPKVLNEVNLNIPDGSFTAVIGHTGAGKSSLLKVLNGLLMPKEGTVFVGPHSIFPGKDQKSLKEIRKMVGMVFQFPESQLFAETVEKDICFGPINFGVSEEEARIRAKEAIRQVGLEPSLLDRSPFSLSGGQKRRVAIAGILAMAPDILVLDEPGAGLDPDGKEEIMDLLYRLHKEKGLTVLLVTHDMEDVAKFAENVVVMEKGKVVYHGSARELFGDEEKMKSWNLDYPEARKFQILLEKKLGYQLPRPCLTLEELSDVLIEVGLV